VALVLVDGENVRRSLWPNLSPDELVARTRAWAAREGHELVVVFDGPPPEEAPDLVGSAHADDEIASLTAEAGKPVWVVTSDRELLARVRDSAERLLGGGAFARMV
jgi:hypothetical protein